MQKLLALLLIGLFAATIALAQDISTPVPTPLGEYEIMPTDDPDSPDAIAKNNAADGNGASVNQRVILILPRATALHLDATRLVFDLRALDGRDWPDSEFDFGNKMVCVYGPGENAGQFGDYNPLTGDYEQQLGPDFYNQTQVLPMGTYYKITDWPNIAVVGAGLVDSYPPIELDEDGNLVPGSKNYFVCYRTFILQKFSNGLDWELQVSRDDANKDRSIQHLYIQDNPCTLVANGQTTALFELPDGGSLQLVPDSLSVGPTGSQTTHPDLPESCRLKSWLDDLVVVAIKINADLAGRTFADLTYTLVTTEWPE